MTDVTRAEGASGGEEELAEARDEGRALLFFKRPRQQTAYGSFGLKFHPAFARLFDPSPLRWVSAVSERAAGTPGINTARLVPSLAAA